jgi:hypothetical protein
MYESRIMARKPDEEVPADLVPCGHYVASTAFQEWAVEQMRKEVMRQVSGAGLDRMAMLKAKPDASSSGKSQSHQSKNK